MLKNGCQWGISIQYAVQDSPNGLAKAFIIGEDFIGNKPCSLILGDNIFYGHELTEILDSAMHSEILSSPSTMLMIRKDTVLLSSTKKKRRPLLKSRKHPNPTMQLPVSYFYDNDVIEIAKSIKPSSRGELEITRGMYLEQDKLLASMWRGTGMVGYLRARIFNERISVYSDY